MELKKILIEVIQKHFSKMLKSDAFRKYIKNIVNECLTEALGSSITESKTNRSHNKSGTRKSNTVKKSKKNRLIDELREMVQDDVDIPADTLNFNHNSTAVPSTPNPAPGLNESMFDPTRNKKLLELMSNKSKNIRNNPPIIKK